MTIHDDFSIDVNELPFETALELYDEMRQAYLDGDEEKLTNMRRDYPTMFEPETALLLRKTADILDRLKKKQPSFNIH